MKNNSNETYVLTEKGRDYIDFILTGLGGFVSDENKENDENET